MTVKTVSGADTQDRKLANFTLRSLTGSYNADVEEALVGKLLTSSSDCPPCRRDVSKFSDLSDITFDDINNGDKIEFIIGVGHCATWFGVDCRRGAYRQPLALKTDFGWTLVGCNGKSRSNEIVSHAIATDDASLKEGLDNLFYHDFGLLVNEEEMGESEDNRRAIEMLRETIHFDSKIGKYVVALPWKEGREKAAATLKSVDAKSMALRRLKSMIPRLRRDEQRRRRIFEHMEKYISNGFAEEIPPEEVGKPVEGPLWYLPIHIVEKKGKTRPCHDARASVDGICLNDQLLGGPNLINSLHNVLLSIRTAKVFFMTDISAFFHHVRIDPRDANVFRYFFFKDPEMTTKACYRFFSQVFGSAASSLITAYVLRYHSEVIRPDFPDNVADMIRDRFYVDDGTGLAKCIEEAITLKENLIKAMGRGGFTLSKWKSSHPEVLTEEEKGPEEPIAKVLGVSWRPEDDCFTFNFDDERFLKPVKTPRHLVALSHLVYDPMGHIAPFQLLG